MGSTQSIPINVRILAATNKNLEEQINQGLFREDLYYRLNIIQITLPPLRERKEDIPLLVGHVIKKFNKLKVGNPIQGIEPEAIRALQNYQFPGNVREMENIIERAIILARTNRLTLKDLGIELTNPKARVIKGTLDEMQKQAIIETLRRWEGNRTRAAEELGINRKTLLNKIKEYEWSDRISFVFGGSTNPLTFNEIEKIVGQAKKNIVILDSWHTKDHVLEECENRCEIGTGLWSHSFDYDSNTNYHHIIA